MTNNSLQRSGNAAIAVHCRSSLPCSSSGSLGIQILLLRLLGIVMHGGIGRLLDHGQLLAICRGRWWYICGVWWWRALMARAVHVLVHSLLLLLLLMLLGNMWVARIAWLGVHVGWHACISLCTGGLLYLRRLSLLSTLL